MPERRLKMRILIIGDDLRTQILTKSLVSAGHHVRLVSRDQANCREIADQTQQDVVFGDAGNPGILIAAGIHHCDLVIAMTEKDADNLVICEMAKKKFAISRTIATVANPNNKTVFQRLGVDAVICMAEACSLLVERAALCPSESRPASA
jgi:trk system potassium uptake protein